MYLTAARKRAWRTTDRTSTSASAAKAPAINERKRSTTAQQGKREC